MSRLGHSPLESLWETALRERLAAAPWKEKLAERLQQIGWPTRRSEAFRYLPLSELASWEIAPSAVSGLAPRQQGLCLVDGVYRPELSDLGALPAGLQMLPLSAAARSFGSYLQARRAAWLREESDPWALLNLGLGDDGLFLYVPPGVHLEGALHLSHLATGATPGGWSYPRMELVLGAGASLEVVWQEGVIAEAAPRVGVVGGLSITLEEGAHLSLLHQTNYRSADWALGNLRIRQKRKSQCRCMALTTGGQSVRLSTDVQLLGEEASCTYRGMTLLEGRRQSHAHVVMRHEAAHCHSLQEVKTVLYDMAQTSLEGRIVVAPGAQKTEAYQFSRHLLLGERVAAFSKPNLQILADDVKASHGCTTARLDESQLFYLRARGLARAQAERVLIAAFCEELMVHVPDPSIRETFLQQLYERLAHVG